jgi:hypothetical protein
LEHIKLGTKRNTSHAHIILELHATSLDKREEGISIICQNIYLSLTLSSTGIVEVHIFTSTLFFTKKAKKSHPRENLCVM